MNSETQKPPAKLGGLRQAPAGWLPLLALLLTMWLAAGCIVTPIGAQGPGATPGEPAATIAIAPVSGAPGDTIFVSGAGWQPGEVVYINLEAVPDTEPVETTVAIATADDEGRFTATFVYPIDPAWAEPGLLDVVAYSLESETRAIAPFEVLEGEPVEEATVEATATVTPTATATPLPGATATPVPQQVTAPTATPTRVASTGNTGVVLSSALNVREGPSTAFRVLRSIGRGTEFTVLGQNNSGAWLFVRLRDGLEGWLARAYTNYTGRAPVVPSPKPPAPRVTPTPTRPPFITGWRGEYYNNTNLSGAPALVRDDPRVDFDWGYNAPGRSIRNDNFSARWVRNVFLPAGAYRFYARADDGVRVWVDGVLVIDEWHASSGRTFSAERRLDSGSHLIRVEFYEASQIARIQVWWEEVGEFGDWRGEYFANTGLNGPPAFVRNERAVDFNWGRGGPANNFPTDRFSVRWTRSLHLDAGTYRFHLRIDDGARLYVDNQLIIDEWRNGSVREATSDIYLDYGVHSLRVEYYEDAGEAVVQLWWERIAEPDQPDEFDDWKGEYWTNRDLEGSPRLVRDDEDIDFNWGTGSPDSRIPSDNFSARWTQRFDFSRGTYRFYARADDGVRVYVGDDRIINEWHDNRADETYQADIELDGQERVKVEYYERTGGALIEVWWERIEDDEPRENPFVNVRPSEGGPGTTVVVEGGGFPANTTVNLYLGGLVGAAALDATQAQVYDTTKTDGDGEFAMSFAVPAAWPDGTPLEEGTLVVVVATADFSVEASATFNFVPPPPADAPAPYANVSPSQGGPGTRVTVSGGGFPANTTVHVHLAGLAGVAAAAEEPRSYASTRTDNQGNYSVSFNMPDEWPDDDKVET
ncbi:MAG TPA: PA14 domain-containing protein, partial [Caldilineaceae bacterium]|nr:PA14 domain-containing protein [Caldilineaceae bacterium]